MAAEAAVAERDEMGRLKKGVVLNPVGRTKGTKNKITKDLKTMIEEALNRAGQNVQKKRKTLKSLEPGVAYLVQQAEERPELFMPLVRQLLPAKLDVEVQVMTQEMAELLSVRRDRLAELRGMRDVTPKDGDDVSS